MGESAPIVVIGAGIVGVAIARALQRSGHGVILLDSDEPGKATSYGNAGFIAIDHVLPLARPATLKRIPRMLMDRDGPLTIHTRSIPSLLPWMVQFSCAASSAVEVKKGIESFTIMMAEASVSWGTEIQASQLGNLFRSNGALYVYESEQSFAAGAKEREIQKVKGAIFEVFDGNRAREMAPGLSARIVRGVYYQRGKHTINPYRLVTALVERFVTEGGKVVRGRAMSFGRDGNRITSVKLADSHLSAKAVVIAAGGASGSLTKLLGFKAPLAAERGYHVMLASDNVHFELPVSSAERGFFVTPMEEGLRVAGTTELAAPHQLPSWHRADLLVKHLKEIFSGVGGAERSRWIGERPSLPDFRPAIGRAPGLANVFVATATSITVSR